MKDELAIDCKDVDLEQEEELLSPAHLAVESMTAHAESTSSTFFYLILSLLGQQSDTLSHAASHLGVAHSFTTLLRAFPFHIAQGVMVIPAEITAKHGVNQQEVFTKRETSKGLEDAVFEFATIANDHLMTAREMFKETGGKVPQEVMPLFSAGVRICPCFPAVVCLASRSDPDCKYPCAPGGGQLQCVSSYAANAGLEITLEGTEELL